MGEIADKSKFLFLLLSCLILNLPTVRQLSLSFIKLGICLDSAARNLQTPRQLLRGLHMLPQDLLLRPEAARLCLAWL
jgi:hypothetical protein